MQEFNINTLVDKYNCLHKNIPENIIIIGEIDGLIIKYKYNELDLSKVDCYGIDYHRQVE